MKITNYFNKIAIFLTLAFVSLAPNSMARKSKITLGFDGLEVNTEHLFVSNVQGDLVIDGLRYFEPFDPTTQSSNYGIGASLGYLAYYRGVFVSPELFFDQLNSNTPGFFASEPTGRGDNVVDFPYKDNELSVNYRYGARLKLGFEPFRYVGLYTTIGFANVDYDIRWRSIGLGSQRSYGASELTPIYGLGLHINLHKNLILNLAHDWQEIQAVYVVNGFTDEISIEVLRAGFIFAF